MSFNIGDTVGDYQIAGILGAGGMGKVYKVRNVISDRVEALKVLLPNLATEPELADRFTREIKLLASLNHPNIAALHTALRVENQLLMVMEFVEGRTLEERIKSDAGRLPPREAVDAVIQVLAALGYAHERGVVHRDIKPANMMEMPDGTVKLMDFGIAKASADRRLTMTGTTLGSLYYMSPEQVKGSAKLDGRSDLYSVGVSLYELVTGTRPFKGDSDYSIMVAHLEQQPKPPIEIDPTLPPALNEIILTAIQKDAANRFQTAQAFRGALESVRPMLPETRPGMRAAMPAPAATMPPPPPAMAPTWPQQPAAAPPPLQQFAPAPQPPPMAPAAAPKSHRGLWIGLGALIAVAVIVIAALQLPRFLGTQASAPASSDQAAQPAQEPALPAADVAPPAVAEQTPQPPAVEPSASAPALPPQAAPAIDKVETRRRVTTPAASQAPAASVAETPAPPPQPAEPAASASPVPVQPAKPAVDPAEMAELRERMRLLTARNTAAGRTLKTMEARLQASGLGLRGDISAAWDRASDSLEEARAAMKDGDAAAIRRALESAERDVDRLDKFLGR